MAEEKSGNMGYYIGKMVAVKTIGIVGGGQLGRMLTLAAKPLGYEVIVLESSVDCPAGQVGARVIEGGLYDKAALQTLADQVDVVTVEIEHLDAGALAEISKTTPVHPAPETIRLIQDKYLQKVHLAKHGIAVADFVEVTSAASAKTALKKFGGKMMLKTRHGAYDGRGNILISSEKELSAALKELKGKKLYAEKLVDFVKELAVIIARDTKGNTKVYDVVETRHERSICLEVLAPADVSKSVATAAKELAEKVSPLLKGAGVFAIEMFLTKDNEVLVNEIAPRVHNSGHHSIEACETSQFEQHIRAITGLPLGSTRLRQPTAVMINILGEAEGATELDHATVLDDNRVHMHWYGKSPVKVDRKMGHITVLGDDKDLVRSKARKARKALKV